MHLGGAVPTAKQVTGPGAPVGNAASTPDLGPSAATTRVAQPREKPHKNTPRAGEKSPHPCNIEGYDVRRMPPGHRLYAKVELVVSFIPLFYFLPSIKSATAFIWAKMLLVLLRMPCE